jgi:hypothetical protein
VGNEKRFSINKDGETLADVLTDIFSGELTKKWLAIKLGISEETVARWCKGETVPNTLYFAATVKALPVDARLRLIRAAFHGCEIAFESTQPIRVTINNGPMHYAAEANMEMAEVIFTIQKAMADKSIALSEQLQIQEEIADVVERLDRTQVSMGA